MKGWFLEKIESVTVINKREPPLEEYKPKLLPIEIERKVRKMVQDKTGAHVREIEVLRGPWQHLIERASITWTLKATAYWFDTHFRMDVSFDYYADDEDERLLKDPSIDLGRELLNDPPRFDPIGDHDGSTLPVQPDPKVQE